MSADWRRIMQEMNLEQQSQTLLWEAQFIYNLVS